LGDWGIYFNDSGLRDPELARYWSKTKKAGN
jgi:hypothetical protein